MIRHEQFSVATGDGWQLPLHRIAGSQHRYGPPVLLLHGLLANGYCFFHQPGNSLAVTLAEQGFEVWLLEFRGTQGSWHPRGEQAYRAITVTDKIAEDLPRAVDEVRQRSGADVLDVVGHSLGGTVLYGYLGRCAVAPIRRCVTISAAVRYDLPAAGRALGVLAASAPGRRLLPTRVPMRRFSQLGATTHIVFPARRHFNLANMERQTLLRMMRHGIEDAPIGELLQLLKWADQRDTNRTGLAELAGKLPDIRQPTRLIGGAADQHCPVPLLREVMGYLGCNDKSLVVVGRNLGAKYDYGHTDLLLGPRAPLEVFPHIIAWLEQQ